MGREKTEEMRVVMRKVRSSGDAMFRMLRCPSRFQMVSRVGEIAGGDDEDVFSGVRRYK